MLRGLASGLAPRPRIWNTQERNDVQIEHQALGEWVEGEADGDKVDDDRNDLDPAPGTRV